MTLIFHIKAHVRVTVFTSQEPHTISRQLNKNNKNYRIIVSNNTITIADENTTGELKIQIHEREIIYENENDNTNYSKIIKNSEGSKLTVRKPNIIEFQNHYNNMEPKTKIHFNIINNDKNIQIFNNFFEHI